MTRRNTDADCPICGESYDTQKHHACPQSVLNSIDSANSRAWNLELAPPTEHPPPLWRTLTYRLREGEALLRMRGDR